MERTIIKIEDDRTGLEVETLKRAILDNLFYLQGRFPEVATQHDWYMALSYTVRDRLLHRWISTVQQVLHAKGTRVIGYLSAEYLPGPHLINNIINMGITDNLKAAIEELGLNLEKLSLEEEEPGLGNGGLGRLAACYLDSLSTLDVPAIGYGIRYEFGIFDQEIRNGEQVEITDKWLRLGNPWEIARPEMACEVGYGGHCESWRDDKGRYRVRWIPDRRINGVPYDTPIPGYKTNTANTLRLWKAEAPDSFNFQAFNQGDYPGAVAQKISSENISKVLYPNDDVTQGKILRLEQQYFFVACSLHDMIRLFLFEGGEIENLHHSIAFQMNDTHPSIAVAELMRILVDEYDMEWEKAWDITQKTFAYTNHTLLPEALEKWPVDLFGNLLPRHLQIIEEINRRFLDEVRKKFPGDEEFIRRISLFDESGPRSIRMAHLACLGGHAVNGVAALHSELLKKYVLADFYKLTPEKFTNVTNGVTPRRWMVVSNPGLTNLLNEVLGEDWPKNLDKLSELEKYASDKSFCEKWQEVKRHAKADLSDFIWKDLDTAVNPDSMFDVQVKRIHEYKRQHLNVLNVIATYNELKRDPKADIVPRTFIFGGKAAPGYVMAKLIIRLINSVANVVNNDPVTKDLLRVVFLPDYRVSLGQRVYPAANLSEQISMAGKEASGTGNMKFTLNGALTVGTLDGANIEIRECVGADNFFLFGLTAEEVMARQAAGYRPREVYDQDSELHQIIDQIAWGDFSNGERSVFAPLVDSLLNSDPYFVLADFRAYRDCQRKVDDAWRNQTEWTKMSILNTARSGKFSSDRAVKEYCERIWHVKPQTIELMQRSTEYCALPLVDV